VDRDVLRAALRLAGGDAARLKIEDEQTVIVLNRRRGGGR